MLPFLADNTGKRGEFTGRSCGTHLRFYIVSTYQSSDGMKKRWHPAEDAWSVEIDKKICRSAGTIGERRLPD
jgi:hypothetical protein